MKKIIWVISVVTMFTLSLMALPAIAPGATKIDIRDNTQDGLQETDPYIGFVVFNQDANGRLIIEVW